MKKVHLLLNELVEQVDLKLQEEFRNTFSMSSIGTVLQILRIRLSFSLTYFIQGAHKNHYYIELKISFL